MALNKYFQDELTALRQLGAEFAEANPRLAPFLAAEAQDPDVERLLEGFAFLTGRLREKLEDELPELTHSVMNLLWPNFLKPLPSLSIVELNPLPGFNEKKRIERGTSVLSVPVDSTQCRFQTCFDVDVYPLKIADITHKRQTNGSNLSINLGLLDDKANLDEMNLDTLRFHLFGDIRTSYTLYQYFCCYLQSISVSIIDSEGNRVQITSLDKYSVLPSGFGEKQNLLPYKATIFHGYRILQEYFALPEKFLFIELNGLDSIAEKISQINPDSVQSILLECQFDRTLNSSININKDSIRLFCTPVVNLFEHQSAPVKLDHKQVEYRLLPAAINPRHYEIYQVNKVEGWGYSDFKRKQYPLFESFEHSLHDEKDSLYYRIRVKESPDAQALDSYISFINNNELQANPQEEVIEAGLICTNRKLPVKLAIGDINMSGESMPEFVEVSNISQVTPEFTPPMDKGFHWQLISNMSLNYQSLMNKEALGVIFSTYDYRSYYDRQQARASRHRLDGIDSIHTERVDRVYKGQPVRGLRSIIRVLESKFTNEGEMYLFFSVLNEFFALYVSLNSFHELVVKGIEHGETYRWPVRIGQQPVI